MNDNAIETLAAALGYTPEDVAEMATQGELYMVIEKHNFSDKPCFDSWISDELAELKREQREFGRSRLAQFGKTFTDSQCVKPRPYWFRVRSFCVRSPYG